MCNAALLNLKSLPLVALQFRMMSVKNCVDGCPRLSTSRHLDLDSRLGHFFRLQTEFNRLGLSWSVCQS